MLKNSMLWISEIRNIPTVVLVENGKEVRRFTGVKSLNEILNFYN
jgi:thioredoxin-like negative regulator of GroEL